MSEVERIRWRRNVIEGEIRAMDRRLEKASRELRWNQERHPDIVAINRELVVVLEEMRCWMVAQHDQLGAQRAELLA